MAYQLMPWVAKYKAFVAGGAGLSLVTGLAIAITGTQMRDQLLKHNLYDATSDAKYERLNKRIRAQTLNCEIGKNARSADGSCNNLDNPAMGMVGVRFGRNVPLAETFHETPESLLSPNPREISRKLLTRTKFKPATIINFTAASWLQFMTHDWFNHGDNQTSPDGVLAVIDLTPDDPLYSALTGKLIIYKTLFDPNTDNAVAEPVNHKGQEVVSLPQGYKNVVTHWWDGSQLYGSSEEQIKKVRGPLSRSRAPGEVQTDHGYLPLDRDGLPVTGFNENWWLGLSMLHQLFIQEHNSIARALVQAYPESSPEVQARLNNEYWRLPEQHRYDQYIFDKARLINCTVFLKWDRNCRISSS